MRKKILSLQASACLLSILILFSACLKDDCRHSYKLFIPVYKKLSDLRAAVQSKSDMSVSNAGKLYINGKWIFLNEQNKGIHVIDNSNPAHPVKAAFIDIPGNVDMSVKGNILYADLYSDLVAINISDPKHIVVSKFLSSIFPERASYASTLNPDSINIITGWTSRDTVVSCSVTQLSNNCNNCIFYAGALSTSPLASSNNSATGTAGSMARFAAVDNYLYAVSVSNLNVINISETANPLLAQKKGIGWDVETIFPYNNKLYMGAASNMTVYDLQNPADPQLVSWSGHWCSHDPVVADDNYAYVTLHAANVCGSTVNDLEIYNIVGNASTLVKTYPLKSPQGLSKDGKLLFVCDDGLKIYDVTDVLNLKLIKHISDIESYDVIADNGIAYLVSKNGLYQYDYSNLQNIHLLSKL